MSFNIAIDGPAGAGKSTIAKRVAKELGFIYVDTGAMYRAIAVYMLQNQIDIQNAEAVGRACRNISVSLSYDEKGEQQVILNGENVTALLRTEEVSHTASVTSANPAVRAALLDLQRDLAAKEDVLMDGRDIGTNVLPGAQLKIYLTASAQTRAKRRFLEMQEKGDTHTLEEIEKEIRERDERDMSREIAPLRQAEDAILVDSSDLSIDQVVERIRECYREVKTCG